MSHPVSIPKALDLLARYAYRCAEWDSMVRHHDAEAAVKAKTDEAVNVLKQALGLVEEEGQQMDNRGHPMSTTALDRLQAMAGRGPFRLYRCVTCGTDATMTDDDLDTHLANVHGLGDAPGSSLVVILSDGAEYIASVTAWTFGHVQVEEYRQAKRRHASVWDVDAMDDLPPVTRPIYYVTDQHGQRVNLRAALAALGLLDDEGH